MAKLADKNLIKNHFLRKFHSEDRKPGVSKRIDAGCRASIKSAMQSKEAATLTQRCCPSSNLSRIAFVSLLKIAERHEPFCRRVRGKVPGAQCFSWEHPPKYFIPRDIESLESANG